MKPLSVAILSLVFTTTEASADIIFTESFLVGSPPGAAEYTLGATLSGQGPTNSPFAGNWSVISVGDGARTVGGGLTYSGLSVAGGHLQNNNETEGVYQRSLSTGGIVADQLGFSMLHRLDADIGGVELGLSRLNFSGGGVLDLRHLNSAGDGFTINGESTGLLANIGDTNFLYGLLTDEGGTAGSDLIQLFVNPTDVSSLSTIVSTAIATVSITDQDVWDSGQSVTSLDLGFGTFGGSLGASSMDEIQLESFAAVPEPSSLLLLTVGLFGLFCFKLKKQCQASALP